MKPSDNQKEIIKDLKIFIDSLESVEDIYSPSINESVESFCIKQCNDLKIEEKSIDTLQAGIMDILFVLRLNK